MKDNKLNQEINETILIDNESISSEDTNEDVVNEDTIEDKEVSEEEQEILEMEKLFDDIVDQFQPPDVGLYFSVSKFHFKEKPEGANIFDRILNNFEECDIDNPYSKDQLQRWLEQGSPILPYVEYKRLRIFTLLVLDVDNDCPELWEKYNCGKPFDEDRVKDLYLALLGYPIGYYETYSSTEECKRFRLIYDLLYPLTTNEFKVVYSMLAKKYSIQVTKINENGEEVTSTKCIIDPTLGDSHHIVFGTNKDVEVSESISAVDSLKLLDIVRAGGVDCSRFTTYRNLDLTGFNPVVKVVPRDETLMYNEYSAKKHLYRFTNNRIDFDCFNIANYDDLLSHLFPDIHANKLCPNPDHIEGHKGHHFYFSPGNCGKCFSSNCSTTVIHNNDLLRWYYGIKDNEILYFILCDMLGVEPINDYCKEYISDNSIPFKNGSQEEIPEVSLEDFDLEELDTLVAKDKKKNHKKTTSNIRTILNFLGIRFRCNLETNGLEIFGNISLLEGDISSINGAAASIENLLIELDYKIPLKTIKLYLTSVVTKLGALEEETFSQKKAVDLIIEKYRVKTYGNDFYLYIDGGYVKDTSEILQTEVWKIIPEGVATANVRDSICKVIASNTCVLSTDDRDYISFKNGLFNLKTWKLEPNSDSVFCIYKKEANYKPFDPEEFEKSALKRYLDTTFKCNKELIHLFGLILANAIRPEPREFAYLVHFLGGGSNGKSLAVRIIEEVATVISTQEIETLGTSAFSTSGLVGSNVNICAETNSATIRNSAVLKSLATGDPVKVEFKFHQPKKMRLPIMLVFNENTMPRCTDTTDGWNRRQLIVPFEQKFVHADELHRNPFALPIDITLEPTIINNERDLLFSWVIENLKELMDNDYKIFVPKECRRMKEKYEEGNDPVGSYITYLRNNGNGYEHLTIEEFKDNLYSYCNKKCIYLSPEDTTETGLGMLLSKEGFRKTKDSSKGGKHVYAIPKVNEIKPK